MCDDEPFLLLLEDYILYKSDMELFYECASTIEMYSTVGMIRLVPIPGPTQAWSDFRGRSKRIGRLDKSTHASYCVSLQAAMWKPSVLWEVLEPDLNPWKTEGRGSRRIAQGKICHQYQFLCTYKPALNYKNLLRRGKLDEDTLTWLKRQGVNTDALSRSAS
jgi:hypothetical protein